MHEYPLIAHIEDSFAWKQVFYPFGHRRLEVEFVLLEALCENLLFTDNVSMTQLSQQVFLKYCMSTLDHRSYFCTVLFLIRGVDRKRPCSVWHCQSTSTTHTRARARARAHTHTHTHTHTRVDVYAMQPRP